MVMMALNVGNSLQTMAWDLAHTVCQQIVYPLYNKLPDLPYYINGHLGP